MAPVAQRAVAAIAHRTASFRYRNFLPVIVLLAAGAAFTAMAGGGFLDLAERVLARSAELQRVDMLVHLWAATHRGSGSTVFFTVMTILGSPAVLIATVVLVAIVLLVRARYRWAAYLVFTTGGGGLLVTQLKLFFLRARPELAEALRHASGYSFPSGHAMGSTVVAGALSYLAFRSLRTWRARSAALAGAATFVLAVALSRVYLGVHWISDVGAGITAGTIWVTVTTVAYETFRRIRQA